ncbi:MAG: hypothetical protein K8823_797 [Cenarchaeum symbiont of Oopsacas minuta]|nr:hypothetical protein [Cenarchaeum symbiont of Oopsacas minuta]
MGFFRNKANDDAIKKAESELLRDDEPKVKESAPLPSLEEVQRDARRKELDAISGEIEQKRREVTSLEEIVSTKQQLRISIEEKLSDVRLEYDNAVGNLMSTKKELNEKRRDIRSASAELENVQKRLTDIIADTASAETIRKKKDDELKSTEKQHVVVKSQIAEMERQRIY